MSKTKASSKMWNFRTNTKLAGVAEEVIEIFLKHDLTDREAKAVLNELSFLGQLRYRDLPESIRLKDYVEL